MSRKEGGEAPVILIAMSSLAQVMMVVALKHVGTTACPKDALKMSIRIILELICASLLRHDQICCLDWQPCRC